MVRPGGPLLNCTSGRPSSTPGPVTATSSRRPVFDDRRNADITVGIYRRVPVLWNEADGANPWGLSFLAMLHVSNDSGLFQKAEDAEHEGWGRVGNRYVRGDDVLQPLSEA